MEAWRRYRIATDAGDVDLARAELDAALAQIERDEERQSYMTRKLLAYIREQTGIAPLPGEGDIVVHYSRLRNRASSTLHDDGAFGDVSVLYEDAIGWFVRFFTPPDERVTALVDLAARPYEDGVLDVLRNLALNASQLGLFYSRVADASWLDPLYEAGFLGLPQDDEPWPAGALVGGPLDAGRVADVLERLLDDSANEDLLRRVRVAATILRSAWRVGAAAHGVVGKIIKKYANDRFVRMIAVSIARDTDPTESIQVDIAEIIVGNEPVSDGGYQTRTVLRQLADGFTAENLLDRLRLVAAKTRRLAADDRMRYITIDIAALHSEGEDLRDPVLILANEIARMIPLSRALGVDGRTLQGIFGAIPGELGERIVCQVLAGADDVDRDTKLRHIATRMASQTATGDDRDLIEDILNTPLSKG